MPTRACKRIVRRPTAAKWTEVGQLGDELAMHVCVRVRERRLTYYWSLFVLACLLVVVVACGIDRSSWHLAFLLGIASRQLHFELHPGAAQVDCGLDPSRFPPSPSDSHHGQQSMADDESLLLPKRPPAAAAADEAEEEGDQSRALSSFARRNTRGSKAAGM